MAHRAKSKYQSSQITDSTSNKHLYSVSKTFLGRDKSSPVLTRQPPDQLPCVFSEYFLNKVKSVYDDRDLR